MKKIRLFEDIYAFEYKELTPYLTYVYVIVRGDTLFIIDTFCGSDYMEEIKTQFLQTKYIIINSHFHFDHIWGNAAFKDYPIYAHQQCLNFIQLHGQTDLLKYHDYLKGEEELVYPNHLILKKHLFKQEQLELIYTPGHSLDSISIIDHHHHIMFVGDNLEKPIIQFEKQNLLVYKKTLEKYIDYPIELFFGGHNLYINKHDIKEMVDYLKKIEAEKTLYFNDLEIESRHLKNLE